ncbi:MAG: hypothetical protein ACFFG0_22685 [Candidatus Thorarchaeota archaeon]
MVFVEGLSMYPLFEPGSRVPVKLMPSGTEYEVGDIIVFKSFDSYIIHAVIDSYVYKGKTYYVTGGLNQETNPYVDCTTISSDHILGLADFSEEFLAGIPALESQGLLFEMKAYGMINQFDTLLQRAQEVHERIANIDQNNKEAVVDVLLDYMELIIEFKRTNTDHLDIRNQFIQASIEADFLASYLHIVNNIFTGYSSDLFKQMFGKILGKVLDPNNPRAIRGDLNEAFDKLKILTEIIICVDNFYRLDKALDELQDHILIQNQGDKASFVDQLTKSIWHKTYTQLLLESVWDSQFLDLNLVNEIEAKFGYRIDLNELVGITNPLRIIDDNGNNLFDFGPIWTDIGKEIYGVPHSGNGFEHIIQEHLKDFKKYGYDTTQKIRNLIFNTINRYSGVIVAKDNKGVEIAYRMRDESGNIILDKNGNPQFLGIILWFSEYNKIHTAYPTFETRNKNLNAIFNDLSI